MIVTEVHPLFDIALRTLRAGQDGLFLPPGGRDTLERALWNLRGSELEQAASALTSLACVLASGGCGAASKGILAVTAAALLRPAARRSGGDLYGA